MTVAEIVAPSPTTGRGLISERAASAIGWSAFAIGFVVRLLDLWLITRMGPDTIQFALNTGVQAFVAAVILGFACSAVGAVIVARRPANSIGWLYVVVGFGQAFLTAGLAYAGLVLPSGPDDLALTFTWFNGISDFAAPVAAVAFILALYPDGAFAAPRWRTLGPLIAVGVALRALEVGFGAPTLLMLASAANPYRLAGPIGDALAASERLGIASVILAIAAAGGAASLVARYRAASGIVRRQILWLLLAGGLVFLCFVPRAYDELAPAAPRLSIDAIALSFASLSLIPVATLIAITRYRLYEIDRIVNRTLVYGSLTAILAGVFTAGIALAQRIFIAMTHETSDAAIVITTLVVATLYAPLRKRLEAFVDRRFKFDQGLLGPYHDELSRLVALVDPAPAASRLVTEVVRELGLTGAAVVDSSGEVTATAGAWPPVSSTRVAVPGGRGAISALVLGPRTDRQPLDQAAISQVVEVARLVVVAVGPRLGP